MKKIKLCECGCGVRVKNRYVRGHCGRGKKRIITDETKKKMSDRIRERLALGWKPKSRLGTKQSEVTKEKLRRALEKRTEEGNNPFSKKGKEAIWYGRRHKEETKDKMSKSAKGKKFSKESREKMSRAKKKWSSSTEVKEMLSRVSREKFSNPIVMEKWRKSLNRKINKVEAKMYTILQKLFPEEWRYTGDYSFMMGRLNPDFINEKRKIALEVFGDYWHREDMGVDRILHFRNFNYDTIIVREKEINRKDSIRLERRILSLVSSLEGGDAR